MKKILFIIIICILLTSNVSAFSLSLTRDLNNPNFQMGDGKEEKWALLVGTGLLSCPYSINDALDMRNALLGRGWKSSHIKCITGLVEATKKGILNNINGWLDLNEDSDDVVLFFFSGHGSYGRIYGANIIQGIDSSSYEISSTELDNAFNNLESTNVVIILDSCGSGSFTDVINPLSKPGRMILAACGPLEKSYSYEEYLNGIFTYFISNALEYTVGFLDADINNDKCISAKEAFNYAKIRTPLKHPLQHPQLYDGILGDTIITKQAKSKQIILLNPLLSKLQLITQLSNLNYLFIE